MLRSASSVSVSSFVIKCGKNYDTKNYDYDSVEKFKTFVRGCVVFFPVSLNFVTSKQVVNQPEVSCLCFPAAVPVPSEPITAGSLLRGRAHGRDGQHDGGGAQSAAAAAAAATTSTAATHDPGPAPLRLLLLRRPLPLLPGIRDLVRLHALWQISTFQEELQQAHVHPLR